MVNFSPTAAVLLALSSFVPSARGDGVMTVQDAILEEEISKLIEQGPSQSTVGEAARTFVPTRIPKTLANRLYGLLSSSLGITCENSKDGGGAAACTLDNDESPGLNTNLLDITTLTGNSQPHVDCVAVMTDNAAEFEETEHEPSHVAFIPLESNPNAVFVHGQEKIPIEKGTMIQFDGRIHHNTQVVRDDGGGGGFVTPVRMLGPFTWKSDMGFARVMDDNGTTGTTGATGKKSKTSGPKSAKSGAGNGLPCED